MRLRITTEKEHCFLFEKIFPKNMWRNEMVNGSMQRVFVKRASRDAQAMYRWAAAQGIGPAVLHVDNGVPSSSIVLANAGATVAARKALLSAAETDALEAALAPALEQLVAVLADAGVVHNDLHDGNLVFGKTLIVLDWSEAYVGQMDMTLGEPCALGGFLQTQLGLRTKESWAIVRGTLTAEQWAELRLNEAQVALRRNTDDPTDATVARTLELLQAVLERPRPVRARAERRSVGRIERERGEHVSMNELIQLKLF